jgi:hypothetical protein
VVVTWSGTDGSGKYMRSGNKGLGMFVEEKFDSIWKGVGGADFKMEGGVGEKMASVPQGLVDATK